MSTEDIVTAIQFHPLTPVFLLIVVHSQSHGATWELVVINILGIQPRWTQVGLYFKEIGHGIRAHISIRETAPCHALC